MPEQPLRYHPDFDGLGDAICDAIASSPFSLKRICKDNHAQYPDKNDAKRFPDDAIIYKWIKQYPHFAEKYYRARELQVECMMQHANEIASDDTNDMYQGKDGFYPNPVAVRRHQLIITNIQWQATKLSNRYKDKQVIEQHNISHEDKLKELASDEADE